MSTDESIPPRDRGDLDKWLHERLGKLTASRMKDVIAVTTKGPSASRDKYKLELIAERLTGMQTDHYVNAAMIHGQITEKDAVRAYEESKGIKTETVWFVPHPKIENAGASPDRRVGDNGLLEVKCPNTATHIVTLLEKKVSKDHQTQIQWQLACDPSRAWADYASYDPRLPPALRLVVIRVPRDEAKIAELEKHAKDFLAEIDAAIKSLGTFEPIQAAVVAPADSFGGPAATVQPFPANMERQIRPEDEANWQPSQLVRPRA